MQKEMGVVLLGREGGVSSIVYDRAGSNACMRLLANNSLRSAGGEPSRATVTHSHVPPASASNHQSGNSVFLSHNSSSSLQLQPVEHSE